MLHKYVVCVLLLLLYTTLSPIALTAKAKGDDKPKGIDTAKVMAEQEKLVVLSSLVPRNYLTARTGDAVTDNVFSNFTIPQIQVILSEYEKKLERSKAQKQKILDIGLELGEQFTKIFADSKVIDEVAIRYADMLYEKVSDEFYAKYAIYTEELRKYLNSPEYEQYSIAEARYDSIAAAGGDTIRNPRPTPPPGRPIPPDPQLDRVIALYDKIINEMPESPYVVDALYNKAYILGERYGDYRALRNLSAREIRQKKEEAIALLQQLTRKYPDSRYTVDAYMLIGEYLFSAPNREQPAKTREAIPYYRKALDLILRNGQRSEYYNQALYKLGWCFFRLENYSEAIAYFTQLIEDIEQAEEIFSGKIMPDYIRPDMKREAIEYIAASFIEEQNRVDRSKTAIERVDKFYAAMPPRRYIPLVYEEIGRKYEELLESAEKVNEVWIALLRRFPNYERAPFIADKIIYQLYITTINGEKKEKELEEAEQRLYEERKNLFYNYGRKSKWYADMKRRMQAQALGLPLDFKDQSVFPTGFDPRTLEYADSISKVALFQNIVYAISFARLLDGELPLPLGREYMQPNIPDLKRAKQFYEQAVKDIENYTDIFSRYDSTAYFAEFQRSLILDFKLNRPRDALPGYLNVARNFAWDFHRKEAIGNAYAIIDSITRAQKIGFYTPGLDTTANFAGKRDSLTADEKLFLEVVDTYIRLFPHDSISVNGIKQLADFYIAKGYVDEYKEVNSRLALYYPIQEIYPGTLVNLAANAYELKDYTRSEQIAKAIYYGRRTKDPKDAERRAYAYRLIGSSIDKRAQYYVGKGNYYAAAKEYERITKEVPKWEEADKAARNAAFYYVKAGKTEESVRISNYLFENANDPRFKVEALKDITYAYEQAKSYDSLGSSLERLYEFVKNDSIDLAEDALYRAIRARMAAENWKEAIRVSDKYLAKFDTTRRGDDVAFNKIDLNVKDGRPEGVFEAYGAYADKFVTKPRSVVAYFKRGEILEERGNIEGAKAEFTKATDRYYELAKKNEKNTKAVAGIAVSESMFRLTKYLLDEYKKVGVGVTLKPSAFVPPPKPPKQKQQPPKIATTTKKKTTQAAKPAPPPKPKERDVAYDTTAKYALRRKIEKNILELYKLGGYRSIDALYNAGFVAENLADAFSKVPDTLASIRDPKTGRGIIPAKLTINQVQANVDAAAFYERAGNDYAKTYQDLTAARGDFEKASKEQDSIRRALINPNDSANVALQQAIASLGKITNREQGELALAKLVPVTEKWISKIGISNGLDVPDEAFLATIDATTEIAKSKISEMYYKAGKLAEKNVYTYLAAQADEEAKKTTRTFGKGRSKVTIYLGDVVELVQLSQIAQQFVRPAVEVAINTYRRGVERAEKLKLQNQYVELSKAAINELATKAAERSDSLARAATLLFDQLDKQYRNKLDSLTGQPKAKDIVDFAVLATKMNFIINTNYNLTLSALAEYGQALQLLKDANAPQNRYNEVATRTSRFIYEMGEGYRQRAELLKKTVKQWDELSKANPDKFWYSDYGAVKYDPIAEMCQKTAGLILAQVVALLVDYDIQDEYTSRALISLGKIDPGLSKLIGKKGETTVATSGGSGWKVIEQIEPGKEYDWFKRDYSDAAWKSVVENDETQRFRYFVRETDTTFTTKELDTPARAIWYERIVPGAQPEQTPAPQQKEEPKKEEQKEEPKKEGEAIPTEQPAAKPEPSYLAIGETIVLNLTFETGKAKITGGAEALDSLVAKFKEDKNLVVEITPSVVLDSGSKVKPAVLAKQRYDAIVKELTSKGVKKTQLKQGKSITDTVTTFKVIKSSRKTGRLNWWSKQNLASKKVTLVMYEQHFAQKGKKKKATKSKDEELQEKVKEAVGALGNITVEVKDAVVTLSGEVADETAKTNAETAARSVKGVKSVTNNLTVRPPTPQGPVKPQYVYFRKEFTFEGAKEVAQLIMTNEFPFDSLEVYVNDVQVGPDKIVKFKNISPPDSALDNQFIVLNIYDYVVPGKNLVAIRAPGTLPKGAGLKIAINIAYFEELKESDLKALIPKLKEYRKKKEKELEKSMPNPQ
ncbi:MAG: BON domain-containing protein [Chloroherpetonaceae bacterium]|nr:BON domain-containing protein [Chloroherpetonaceae bacterium]